MKQAKLSRLKSLNKRVVKTYDIVVGQLQGEPKLGEHLTIWLDEDSYLQTTPITKIIVPISLHDRVSLFETRNSMYQLEILE